MSGSSQDLGPKAFLSMHLVALVLVLAGVLFLFRPAWLGWGALVEMAGSTERLVSVGVGCAFLVLAALSLEKNAVRMKLAELMEAFHQLLYGKDFRRDRAAIEILLDALEHADGKPREQAHRHLVRLTGKHFAADPKVWRSWWAANQRYFQARQHPTGAVDGSGEGEGPPAPKDGGA